MIVTEPASGGGNVKCEYLLIRGVDCSVVNIEFGLRDACCEEKAATSREVLALYAFCPGGARSRTVMYMQIT